MTGALACFTPLLTGSLTSCFSAFTFRFFFFLFLSKRVMLSPSSKSLGRSSVEKPSSCSETGFSPCLFNSMISLARSTLMVSTLAAMRLSVE